MQSIDINKINDTIVQLVFPEKDINRESRYRNRIKAEEIISLTRLLQTQDPFFHQDIVEKRLSQLQNEYEKLTKRKYKEDWSAKIDGCKYVLRLVIRLNEIHV